MNGPFSLELKFTKTYKQYQNADPAIREIQCLKTLLPDLYDAPLPGDLFVGRMHYPAVGFGLELAAGGPVYYCHAEPILSRLNTLSPDIQQEVLGMLAFWEKEATIEGQLIRRLPEDTRKATSNPVAEMGGRLAGTLLDFDTLVRQGISGLRGKINKASQIHGDLPLYQAMNMALDLLVDVILHYADLTRGEMNTTLKAIACRPPKSFREAAQLAWLYALISGTVNYGRMDVYLGDFFTHDIDAGVLDEAEGLCLVQSLWRLIAARKTIFNGRVFLGGYGRPNEANADRFALVAMEATRTVIEVEPQLTLRFYRGMNPALMTKALDVIGEGRTFPMLYNDDVNVPAVEHAFGVTRTDAEQYLPYGCGEYAIDHISFGSPNCSLNLLKALEVVLHEGIDIQTGEKIGIVTQPISEFTSFDQLWDAYCAQVAYSVQQLATRHKMEVDLESEEAAFLFVSMLYDDCIERGKSLLDGGVQIKGGLIETYGMVNTADSLTAIKTLVYDQKLLTMTELVTTLDGNFEGFEHAYHLMKAAPKFGNDHPVADEMLCRVSSHVAQLTHEQAKRVGLDYFLIVNINNYMNVALGKQTTASAEGRKCGKPLANGNTPTAGNDTQGVTAFLNSLVKPDAAIHAGYTQNMKFSKSLFQKERPKLEALLETYFACGGTQSMITVVGREDLENALKEPEKYRNLIVRVGGFSARYVELDPEIQQDLLARTLY